MFLPRLNPVLWTSCCALLLCSFSGCCHVCGTCEDNPSTSCAAPRADISTTPQDTPKLIDVLANDSSSQGTTTGGSTQLTIASVTPQTTKGGTAVISGNKILYTPPSPSAGPSIVKNISSGIDDATGEKFLQDTEDTEYIIASGGSGGYVGAIPLAKRGPFPDSYVTDASSTASTWLLLRGVGPSEQSVPQGTYYWRTTVNAAGFNPAQMQIVGLRAAADDQIDAIYVNNVVVVNPGEGELGADFSNLGNVGLGAFHAGINTITFVVNNTPPYATDMGLRVEGIVQVAGSAGVTAPFTDTFTYTVNDPCGGTTNPMTVTVNVTAPISVAGKAQVLIVNNSSAEITVSIGGTEVDVVQPRGATVAPRSVVAGSNQSIKVDALCADPKTSGSTSTTATLTPDKAYTITYTNTGKGDPSISVGK